MNATSALTANPVSAMPNRFSELGSEEFVKIIFTELSHQDPLQPNDTGALLEQLSTLRSIQSDIDLGEKLRSVTAQGELASAGTLIGRYVSGRGQSGDEVGGRVRSVSRMAEGPVLNLANGARVRFSAVTQMHEDDPGAAP